ncbi:MAG TPA: RDD family protein [Thermodesulfobacteriota bacterium]|nr:RDD family protein [Thermodesulfobacteriota bacterium]HQO78682.1 RDD family protein [Thermodesulfobacteriota bacterium]
MEWYFAEGSNPVGPLTEEEFQAFVAIEKITPATLVWREGMSAWQTYEQITAAAQNRSSAPVDDNATIEMEIPFISVTQTCSHCGLVFPREDMVKRGDVWECERCQPIYDHAAEDRVNAISSFHYAGFWVRCGARIIDNIIVSVMWSLIVFFAGFINPSLAHFNVDPNLALSLIVVSTLLGIAYVTWFLGRFGATPGKMAFGLLVVRPDGSRISYSQALARCFADSLSLFLLAIGYLMVIFDPQKRALHDRICSTRVIMTKS